MEKITLKPAAKELFYKNGEENVYFDILSCQGSTNQEKNLGSLFIISQVKYLTGDLSYMVSLISSLAKREFYSATSLQEQNPKEAFSRTLKKLNEVLEEFFQNKDFKLNIGLVTITGENIFISRLGKFRINLARNNQFIDILNNVNLFNKDVAGEKQFSNIISGKLQQNDKLFAFFPTRSITSREKQLNDIFLKEGQEEFHQKIATLAANVSNFSCCGVHIDMRQMREIPLRPAPKYSIPITSPASMSSVRSKAEPSLNITAPQPIKSRAKDEKKKPEEDVELSPELEGAEIESDDESLPAEQPRIIPAELSITKRGSFFTPIAAQLGKLRFLNRINNRAKLGIFISLAAIVTAIPVFLIFLKGNDQSKNTIILANDNLKLAQSRLSQNNVKDARSLLQAALFNLSDLSNKKAGDVRDQINQVLADLNHASDKQPIIFYDPKEQMKNGQATLITARDDGVNMIGAEGKLFSAAPDELNELGELKVIPKFLFSARTAVGALDDSGKIAVLDLKSKKISSYSLEKMSATADVALYENNFYLLSENEIYKYADAVVGGTKRTQWNSEPISGKLIALAADGNIYALNDAGKLIKYYKGRNEAEFDLQLSPSADSKIFTAKDSAFLYLADKTNKKVYVFDKSSGELKTSYDLTAAGQIQDIFVSPAGTVWILS
ncbi:MAG: hypothetical protein AAB792_00170, partial [Patescibacteria group bacterium]